MTALRACFDWTIYGISHLVPRDHKLCIFIGWRRSTEREVFAENPKYQFLYMTRHRPDLRCVWIGMDTKICTLLHSKGFEAYPINSVMGVYLSLRAGYTFIGALLTPRHWRLSGGSRVIQLWHSKSLKKTGYNSPYSLSRYNRFLSPGVFQHPFRFVAISAYLARFVTTDFRVPESDLLVTGIPKHDVFFSTIPGAEIDTDESLGAAIARVRETNPARLLLYGPTFRPNGTNPLEALDLAHLNTVLAHTRDHLVVMLHPKFSTKSWMPEGGFSNITFVQNDKDIYPLLSRFDVLISDYSSLTIELLLLGKPVILYAFDLEYFKEGMGIYDDLWELMPGPKTYTQDELEQALSKSLDQYMPGYKEARDTLFDYYDGNAAARITEALFAGPLPKPPSSTD